MANELTMFSVNKGENEYQVAEAAKDTSHAAVADIDVTVIRASSLTRNEVLEGLEKVRNYILRTNWPSV